VACPYRKTHEWDHEGLCRHCYAKRPAAETIWGRMQDVLVPIDTSKPIEFRMYTHATLQANSSQGGDAQLSVCSETAARGVADCGRVFLGGEGCVKHGVDNDACLRDGAAEEKQEVTFGHHVSRY